MTYGPRGQPARVPLVGLRRRAFRLPLRSPLQTARGAIEDREGVLIELLDAEGRRGLGEASPLPGFGAGEASDVLRLLDAHGAALIEAGGLPDAVGGRGSAALRFAIDCALLDLEGQRRHLPVAALLADRPAPHVEVNAVLGADQPPALADAARAAVEAGYRTLKLKVGAARPEEDRRSVQAVRDAAPDAALRLDANGAWDEPVAAAALERLAHYRIEYVEQPVPAAEVEALARLRRLGACRVAADEAVETAEDAQRVLAAEAADLLVLKPARLGGLRPALSVARRAADAGAACVVTTTFESSVGIAALLHLAAALPWRDHAHGLGTAEHLAADLVAATLVPRDGRLRLADAPGLGIEIDEARLEAAATGPWYAVRA